MSQDWTIKRGEKTLGSVTSQKLRALAQAGKLKRDDLVRRGDDGRWRPASAVEGLFPSAEGAATPSAEGAATPSAEGVLVITRNPKLTGFLSPIRVAVDSRPQGRIGGGFPNGLLDLLGSKTSSLSLSLPAGEHDVELGGGGLSRNATVRIEQGRTHRFATYFSNMGAMGGGINFNEDRATDVATSDRAAASTGRTVSKKGLLAALVPVLGLLMLCCGGFRGCMGAGGGTGTITFAEDVDAQTMKTSNEGTEFSTGWVYLVIRGNQSFGDDKLLLYGRPHDEQFWTIIDEQAIDPSWDMMVTRTLLDEPGTYNLKATTSKGRVIAESAVTILD